MARNGVTGGSATSFRPVFDCDPETRDFAAWCRQAMVIGKSQGVTAPLAEWEQQYLLGQYHADRHPTDAILQLADWRRRSV